MPTPMIRVKTIAKGWVRHDRNADFHNGYQDLIPAALIADRFGPLAAGDGGEPVGRRQQPVPGLAAGSDDGVVVGPDAQAELVLPQVLPDVLDRVQLRAVAWQRQEGEVLG